MIGDMIFINQPSYCSRQIYLGVCIEKLLAKFSDMSYDDISDTLEYYTNVYRRKVLMDED